MTPATLDMFAEAAPVYGPPLPEKPPVFWAEVATRKAKTAGWKWCSVRIVGEDRDVFLVVGGVPRVLKSGPRKGQETWDSKSTTEIAVTRAEAEAEAAAYEATTGKCRRCAGSKVHMTASSTTRGVTYSKCWQCGGTGKPTP